MKEEVEKLSNCILSCESFSSSFLHHHYSVLLPLSLDLSTYPFPSYSVGLGKGIGGQSPRTKVVYKKIINE